MEQCTWCGTPVAADDGWRAIDPARRRHAVFCRLEHVVPWQMQGGGWRPGSLLRDGDPDDALGRCVRCGDLLDASHLLLVRHRGEHRIADAFCSEGHLMEWARAGGRFARTDRPSDGAR